MPQTITEKSHPKNLFKIFFDWFLRRPESGIVLILVLFVALATIVNPAFIAPKNIINILRSSGFTMICVVGMSMVLITGGLDLSIGSIYALGALMSAIAMKDWGLPVPVGIAVGLLVGIAAAPSTVSSL